MGLSKIAQQQQDAAMAHMLEHSREHARISELVLGSNAMRRGRQVTALIKLGEDYLVQVKGSFSEPDSLNWTFVVNDDPSHFYHPTQELALLHLLAARHDPNPNSNHMWAAAAGRVLGLPESVS